MTEDSAAMAPYSSGRRIRKAIAWLCLLGGSGFGCIAAGEVTSAIMDLAPETACEEFNEAPGSAAHWTIKECMDVWNDWYGIAPMPKQLNTSDERAALRKTGEELRRAGKPCYVQSVPEEDGAGSSTIRHLSTWIFATEMGCEWVTPVYRGGYTEGKAGASGYCHRVETLDDANKLSIEQRKANRKLNCVLVDWKEYFNFERSSVAAPSSGVTEHIDSVVICRNNGGQRIPICDSPPAKEALPQGDTMFLYSEVRPVWSQVQTLGVQGLPWDHLVVHFSISRGAKYMMSVQSWDKYKRAATRKVVQAARDNFRDVPRQGYTEPQCLFDTTRLNFAMHVRMGDRRQFQHADTSYFRLLELFMNTVTAGVLELGQAPPLFHVFSEVEIQCPDEETGLFDEFPTWPVELDQIQPCWDAPTPKDCPELRAGIGVCRPERSGNFRVQNMPVILHVGRDVTNALSCMIASDGLLMGCSTFGQVAGILTEGIRFFSLRCSGEKTALQNKAIPPIAIAERGEMWVPIDGSWRDPTLHSGEIFKRELRRLLERKGL